MNRQKKTVCHHSVVLTARLGARLYASHRARLKLGVPYTVNGSGSLMSDYLVRAASRPAMRRVLATIGVPTPQTLARAAAPYAERLLADKRVLVGASRENGVAAAIDAALDISGARLTRAVRPASGQDERFDALVFDATRADDIAALRSLYDFFNPVVRRLSANARVVVLAAWPCATDSAQAAAAARAVEGFVRSLAKEIGRFGSTANLIYVEPGAESRLAGPLRFLLSDYSTYVDGQPLTVTAAGTMPRSLPTVQALEGKTALVTGGARGIGAATAARLAAEGAHVVCLDIPADRQTLDATVAAFGGTALALDIAAASAPREIADFFKTRFSGVDIVVHNAGITRDKTLANMPENHWDSVLGVNLAAVVAVDAALAREQIINDHGRVVCLSSIQGIAGQRGQANYSATKAGLIGFVEHRANAQRERGICVNAVAPGFIETRLTAGMPFGLREAGRRLASLGQGGQPRDVAEAITFLVSPGAGGVSGNVLRVCGQSLIGA